MPNSSNRRSGLDFNSKESSKNAIPMDRNTSNRSGNTGTTTSTAAAAAGASSTSGSGKRNSGDFKTLSAASNFLFGQDVSTVQTNMQQAMTDTLVERIIKMALPPVSELSKQAIEERLAFSRRRPNLSVPLMSKNCIQMNARLTIPFVTINYIIEILDWTNVPFTLSVLGLITLGILKPVATLTAGPIFFFLFGVMVPEYIYIHKPSRVAHLESNPEPAQGPPLRDPRILEPVPEFSQEFVINLTDLQNNVLLYVYAYDFIASILNPVAFFTNEQVSCVVFVVLLLLGLFNFLFMDRLIWWIPVKQILIVTIWSCVVSLHPAVRTRLVQWLEAHNTKERLETLREDCESFINQHLRYVEAKEQKTVCIFEIQRYNEKYKAWKTAGFSNSDYTLFSELRVNESNLEDHSCKTLEEVQPPIDWEWVDKEASGWVLDLDPSRWVEGNYIQYVEIDFGSKWVYDVDIDGSRGVYRRRMWTNTVTRRVERESEGDSQIAKSKVSSGNTERRSRSNGEVEVVYNPFREESHGHDKFRGVTIGSMAGQSTRNNPKFGSNRVINEVSEEQDQGQENPIKNGDSRNSSRASFAAGTVPDSGSRNVRSVSHGDLSLYM